MELFKNAVEIIIIIVPLLMATAKYLDIRSAKRQESNREFNTLLLWGIESIGSLTAANTSAIQNQGEAGAETEKALNEYTRFRTEIEKFKNKQTAGTL